MNAKFSYQIVAMVAVLQSKLIERFPFLVYFLLAFMFTIFLVSSFHNQSEDIPRFSLNTFEVKEINPETD